MFVGLVTSIICTALSVFAVVIAYVLPATTNVAMSPAPPISLNPLISSVSVSIATMSVGTEGLESRNCMDSDSDMLKDFKLESSSVNDRDSDSEMFLSAIPERLSVNEIDSDSEVLRDFKIETSSINEIVSDSGITVSFVSETLSVSDIDSDSDTLKDFKLEN